MDGAGWPIESPSVDSARIAASIYLAPKTAYFSGTKKTRPVPYNFVVVAEEKRPRRWVGGPRKPCHVGTQEAKGRSVLIISLRDCSSKAPLALGGLLAPADIAELVRRAGGGGNAANINVDEVHYSAGFGG